ncbi:MAG: manganese efflux pump [Defluviitaleaceae bacterium]|nr:manganese efflux pump [Defluviitaleaceae bacterium]
MSDIVYALALALVISIDAFVCAFAYGSERIRVPAASVAVITAVCTAVLMLSMSLGGLVMTVLPGWLAPVLSFAILFALGAARVLDGFVKRLIRRRASFDKQVRFRALGLSFILHLYADPSKADLDSSKTISPREAAALAVALSLDSVAVGISAALAGVYMIYLALAALAATALALTLGLAAGRRISRSLPIDVSSAGGVVLILLALARLVL